MSAAVAGAGASQVYKYCQESVGALDRRGKGSSLLDLTKS